ncbi:hypothetical protein ACKWTF_004587 [Chironomus riparius]
MILETPKLVSSAAHIHELSKYGLAAPLELSDTSGKNRIFSTNIIYERPRSRIKKKTVNDDVDEELWKEFWNAYERHTSRQFMFSSFDSYFILFYCESRCFWCCIHEKKNVE